MFQMIATALECLVVSMSAAHAAGHEFVPRPGHTKDHYKNGTNCLTEMP